MSLPPLASTEDILLRAPELEATIDLAQAEALLEDASAMVRAHAGRNWVNDEGDELEGVPDGIAGLVARIVTRAIRSSDDGVRQETVGNWSAAYADTGLYLKTGEKRFIRRVSSGVTGAFSVDTFGEVGYLGQAENEDWS